MNRVKSFYYHSFIAAYILLAITYIIALCFGWHISSTWAYIDMLLFVGMIVILLLGKSRDQELITMMRNHITQLNDYISKEDDRITAQKLIEMIREDFDETDKDDERH